MVPADCRSSSRSSQPLERSANAKRLVAACWSAAFLDGFLLGIDEARATKARGIVLTENYEDYFLRTRADFQRTFTLARHSVKSQALGFSENSRFESSKLNIGARRLRRCLASRRCSVSTTASGLGCRSTRTTPAAP